MIADLQDSTVCYFLFSEFNFLQLYLLRNISSINRFHAMLYPCPDTAAERREMAIGVTTRIENLQTVSNKY